MARAGGEAPAVRTMVSAGPEVWCRTHGAPGRRPVERGDVMWVSSSKGTGIDALAQNVRALLSV